MCFEDQQRSSVESIATFFCELVCHLYSELNDHQPELPDYFNENSRIELGNVSFFITVHAPVYDITHSRYSFGNDLVIGFQPYESFTRFKVKEAHQKAVRKRFEKDGKTYSPSPVVESQNELEKFIKPESITEEPLRWWE